MLYAWNTFTSYPFQINFNIILPYTPMSPYCFFSLGWWTTFVFVCYIPRPNCLGIGHQNNILWRLGWVRDFPQSLVAFILSGLNIFLSASVQKIPQHVFLLSGQKTMFHTHPKHQVKLWIANYVFFFFFKSQFILQSVVIQFQADTAECYGEEVLQCPGERPSVGPLRR
jgi:hypothetical protein